MNTIFPFALKPLPTRSHRLFRLHKYKQMMGIWKIFYNTRSFVTGTRANGAQLSRSLNCRQLFVTTAATAGIATADGGRSHRDQQHKSNAYPQAYICLYVLFVND